MKRIGKVYERVIGIDNLKIADKIARRGKSNQFGVKSHMKNMDQNIIDLHQTLNAGTFKTSDYKTFTVFEPKERLIFCLPYYPDRIVHHAIMNVLEPMFVKTFTSDTYSCIKGRGIHSAQKKLNRILKNVAETTYCLKLDVRKFYPSVDHQILKQLLKKKIKDNRLLLLLNGIIDSAQGLPIGNYLSQYFANFYLTYFDHWIKEDLKVKHYFRYADDMVILSSSKPELHQILAKIRAYLKDSLKLEVKGNYQVFPVAKRGIDFIGYKFFHSHILLRKTIKKRFAKAVSKRKNHQTISAYYGWAKHCNSSHLIKKLIYKNETF